MNLVSNQIRIQFPQRKYTRVIVLAIFSLCFLIVTKPVAAQVVNIVEDQASPAPVASPETSASPTTNTLS